MKLDWAARKLDNKLFESLSLIRVKQLWTCNVGSIASSTELKLDWICSLGSIANSTELKLGKLNRAEVGLNDGLQAHQSWSWIEYAVLDRLQAQQSWSWASSTELKLDWIACTYMLRPYIRGSLSRPCQLYGLDLTKLVTSSWWKSFERPFKGPFRRPL